MRIEKIIFLFFLIAGIYFPQRLAAQDTSKVILKPQVNYKQEFVINNKRYKVWDNWVNFGAGYSFYTNNPRPQFTMGIDFNFHIKQHYINAGGFVSGDDKGQLNNYQVHLGYIPIRRQTQKYHWALVAAPSYSVQYPFAYAGHYWSSPNKSVGFYGELQAIRKLEYTTGIGCAVFFDYTPKNFIIGLRIDGYLSGAYKGYIPGKQPNKVY